ncbi:hypothetical protein [Tateyamaria sp.]|uniref:hypothetical protein n=1 Tax=Tateyamaria sp. TaxID=1929288 RepID=UPI003B222C85
MNSEFSKALWDDSDPAYAPFLKTRKGKYYYWVPSKRYIHQGWSIKSYRLEGHPGDGRDTERAAECRRLTRELVQWWEGENTPRIQAGTWGWLIQRYIHDDISSIHDVRPYTRKTYIKILSKASVVNFESFWIPKLLLA